MGDLGAAERAKVVGGVGLGVLIATIPWNPDIVALEPFLRWWISGAALLSVVGCGALVLQTTAEARSARLEAERAEAEELAELTAQARLLEHESESSRNQGSEGER